MPYLKLIEAAQYVSGSKKTMEVVMGNRIEVVHPDPRRCIVMFAFRTLYGMVIRPCNFNPLLFSSPASQALHQFGRRITGNFAIQTTNREKMPRHKPECQKREWF